MRGDVRLGLLALREVRRLRYARQCASRQQRLEALAERPWQQSVLGRVDEAWRRVELLARVLPDKFSLIVHPRPPLDEGSEGAAFARYALQAFELFFWYILAYTLYRTVHENRLKPEDTDPFSEELRRLRDQPYRW